MKEICIQNQLSKISAQPDARLQLMIADGVSVATECTLSIEPSSRAKGRQERMGEGSRGDEVATRRRTHR